MQNNKKRNKIIIYLIIVIILFGHVVCVAILVSWWGGFSLDLALRWSFKFAHCSTKCKDIHIQFLPRNKAGNGKNLTGQFTYVGCKFENCSLYSSLVFGGDCGLFSLFFGRAVLLVEWRVLCYNFCSFYFKRVTQRTTTTIRRIRNKFKIPEACLLLLCLVYC